MASSLKLGSASIFDRKRLNNRMFSLPAKKCKITIPSVTLPRIEIKPKVQTLLTPPDSNGVSRKIVIKIQKPSNLQSPTPTPTTPGYRIVSRTTVIEDERKRRNPYRNPTPSPSPPPNDHQFFRTDNSSIPRRSFSRNPTPSPSSNDESEENFPERQLKHPLAPDQLPVVSYEAVDSALPITRDDSFFSPDKKFGIKTFPWSKPARDNIRRSRFPEIDFDKNLNEELIKRTADEESNQLPVPMDLTLEELEQFAKQFKQKRIRLGFTQGDVGMAMGKMYGLEFSQTTVSRFEALNLSFKNMCRLKVWLDKWLNDTERAVHKGMFEKNLFPTISDYDLKDDGTIRPRRKRRTVIEGEARKVLDTFYETNKHPTEFEIFGLAQELNLCRDVVRVWFCNRRQRHRRTVENFHANRATATIIASTRDDHTTLANSFTGESSTGLLLFSQNKTSPMQSPNQIKDDDVVDSSLFSSADVKSTSQIEQMISMAMPLTDPSVVNHLNQQLDFNEDDYDSDADDDVSSRLDDGEC